MYLFSKFLLPALICSVTLSLTACLPVAWIAPPTKIDIGAGAAMGTPTPDANFALPIGIGVQPLSFPASLYYRSFDFGLGYRGVLSFDGGSLHAPYLEGTYFYRPQFDGDWTRTMRREIRVGVSGRGKVFFGYHLDSPQPAVAMRFFVDFLNFEDREGAECDITNVASWFCGYSRGYGERGWGLYAEAHRSISISESYTGLYAGVYWRIPASAGFGFVGLD